MNKWLNMGVTPAEMLEKQEKEEIEIREYDDSNPDEMTLAEASEYFKNEPFSTKSIALNAYDRFRYLNGNRIVSSTELAQANGITKRHATQYLFSVRKRYPDLMTKFPGNEAIYILAENWILLLEQYQYDYMHNSKSPDKCRKLKERRRPRVKKEDNTIVHRMI
jgi:hypothetical protein